MKEIYLAGGCFWGVSEFFRRMDGVKSTIVGYANGTKDNPTYEEVCEGTTGHAEACYIKFDENVISLTKILQEFWSVIDPTSLSGQGGDIGNQYRTGIFYTNKEDIDEIFLSLKEEQKKHDKNIVTQVLPIACFYNAEEYHQDYLVKNPGGYCHIPLK